MWRVIISALVVLLVVFGVSYFFDFKENKNYGDEVVVEDKSDLIRVYLPKPNDLVKSPLTIKGEARGYWFFEASFPVAMTDSEGNVIGQHYIMTSNDWMTEDFVPFEGVLEFDVDQGSGGNRGMLILQKDNPSGLPEHDDAIEIPVMFE